MRYFIADPHFGCRNTGIIRAMLRCYPGTRTLFPTVEEHDQHLLGSINCTVKPEDELIVAGDFASDQPGKYRMQIKCKHVRLVRGNHDPYQKCRNVFGEIPYIIHTKVRDGEGNHLRVVVCHTPLAYWDGSHRGYGHVYGHTHGQREHTLDKAFGYERRSMDVGVDETFKWSGTYFPLGEDELYNIFMSRKGHDHPSYYHDLQEARAARFHNEER
jgi:calcineurin-like phosphoesterase family protein